MDKIHIFLYPYYALLSIISYSKQILSESDKEIIQVKCMWHNVHETDIIQSNGSLYRMYLSAINVMPWQANANKD